MRLKTGSPAGKPRDAERAAAQGHTFAHVADAPAAALAAENRQLRRTIEQLQRYIRNQNRRLAELRNTPAAASGRQPAAGTTAGNRLYTVQKGDTPGSIARKFYGSASKYPRIMEANHLTGNGNLQVGQKLIIPPAEP